MLTSQQHDRQTDTGRQGPLSVRTVGADSAADVLEQWQSLDQRVGSGSLANSRVWTETWIRHYGILVPHEFLVAEQEGAVQGLCLLTHGVSESRGPFSIRSVHLGTAGEPDADSVCVEYNRLLVEDCHRAEFAREIVGAIEQDSRWDQFQLDGFTVEQAEPLTEAMPGVDVEARVSRYFDLQTARDEGVEILSQLGRSTRGNIRRRLRDYGELTVDWVDTLSRAEEVFSELVSLHQQRWQADGKPGVFTSQRFHDFQLELLTRCLDDRRVVLFRVRQGSHTLGCLMLLVDQNRLLDYLSGFAPFEKNASPGLIVHYLCMNEALRRGYDAYDFLIGERQHKRNLSNAANELLWATWRRDRLKFRLLDAARRLKRTLSRWPTSNSGSGSRLS